MSADSLRLATGVKAPDRGADRSAARVPGLPAAIDVEHVSLWYDDTPALQDISLAIAEHQVTAFIGPSGCGKSTLLRSFNRMNDHNQAVRHEGKILLYGRDIHGDNIDPVALRREVGMVFQKPNPFAKSVFDNVAYGLRLQGIRDHSELAGRVEWALRSAALWDEVEDRLDESALQLSGGQQQRLVIARAIAVRPRVILLDEPCSSLDPISTLKVEELITELKAQYTIVIVTHNMQQAARVSDFTAFLYMGRLVEYGDTDGVFTNPARKQTEDYITGRYG